MNKPAPQTFRQGIGKTRYLTTSIPYVNAAPHIGFALEMVQADCLARLYRLQGHCVRFQAGADENSLKNVLAAEAAGLPVEAFVRRNAERFRQLKPALNLSTDDFLRTSSSDRHRSGVKSLWAACAASGDIYKRAYSGLYCTGCEQFYKAAELVDGCCPEHGTRPERVEEENYFFRLSRYRAPLREALQSGRLQIVPERRANEVLAWIEDGLEDFSISRSAARAHGWGVPVPGDPDQVIYVWFDALGNYITALGYGSGGTDLSTFWRDADRREHVIGKGITRFHAVYWPAMLLSAGLPLPTRIFVHGYVTVDGRKIGKSAGNAVDPVPLAEAFGTDALRYYLLRHLRSTDDSDFSVERLRQAYRSELAGQLGNLAHRICSMIERYCHGAIPQAATETEATSALAAAGEGLLPSVADEVQSFDFHKALARIWSFIAATNKVVANSAPWSLAKAAQQSADARAQLDACLHALAEALALIGCSLAPLLPSTSDRLLERLGLDTPAFDAGLDGRRIEEGGLLFPVDRVSEPAAATRQDG